jgi:hypothetical protein
VYSPQTSSYSSLHFYLLHRRHILTVKDHYTTISTNIVIPRGGMLVSDFDLIAGILETPLISTVLLFSFEAGEGVGGGGCDGGGA